MAFGMTTINKQDILLDLLDEVEITLYLDKTPRLHTEKVTIYINDWVPRRIQGEKELDNGMSIPLEFTLSNTDPLAITKGEFTFDVEIVE